MIYETCFKRLLRLIPDLAALEAGEARTAKSGGFMDLHLDVLDRRKNEHGQTVLMLALAHNYVQNGDLMADPDMGLRVYLAPQAARPGVPIHGMAEALHYQQDSLGIYREVYPAPGKVDPRQKREQNAFLAFWLKNLLAQRFRLAPAANGEETDR